MEPINIEEIRQEMTKKECAVDSGKICYSERETRLIVAWVLITFGIFSLVNWSINATGIPRPPYIIDLLLPAMAAITGVYMLRKKIPTRNG